MRTTLDIDAPVLEVARALAASKHQSIGAVISELAARGLRAPSPEIRLQKTLPVFSVSPLAAPLDPAAIRNLIETDGLPD